MLLAGGCHRHDAFFQSVEDLMVTAPDSALALAEAFEPFGRAEKARRALLIAKAKNKAYIDTSADSLIESAVDYYRGHNDSLEVQALYYSAARYHTLKDYEMALYRLTTAEEKADRTDARFYLAMIQRLTSDCYNELYVIERAEEYATKACENFRRAGKYNHAMWCELLVANAFANNNKADSAINLLIKNRNSDNLYFEKEWHRTMAHAQFMDDNYDEAINNYIWLKNNASDFLESCHYSRLSECYLHTNDIISAKEALKIAIKKSNSWNDSIRIGYLESEIYSAEGDLKRAFSSYKESGERLNSQYDKLLAHPYYKSIDNNLKAKNRQYIKQAKIEKKLRNSALVITFLTIIVATTIIMFISKENKAKKYHIRLLLSQAGELKSELNLLNENNIRAVNETQNILENHVHLLNNICSEWYLLPENKKTDRLFGKKIDSVLSEINSDETLFQFEKFVNDYQDNLIDRICSACPKLTKENKRILIYLSLGLSYDSICFLISKSKSTFAVYRHRLKKTIEESDLKDKEDIIKTVFH